jgi:hypothetical protein
MGFQIKLFQITDRSLSALNSATSEITGSSSPRYPQSNRQSERAVQTIKNLLKKVQESQGDPYIALLEYRNTSLGGVKLSAAQLLMGRRLKARLPTVSKLLQLQLHKDVQKSLKDRQLKQKFYYDCGQKTCLL